MIIIFKKAIKMELVLTPPRKNPNTHIQPLPNPLLKQKTTKIEFSSKMLS